MIALATVIGTIAYGKRPPEYSPPSFEIRFGRSLLGLSMLALPIMSGIVLGWQLNPTRHRHFLLRPLATTIVLLVLGATFAALDAVNDEGWQPALFGTPFLLMAIPIAYWVGTPAGDRKVATLWLFAAAAVIGVVPCISLVLALTRWAASKGWPVTW